MKKIIATLAATVCVATLAAAPPASAKPVHSLGFSCCEV